MNFYKTFRRIMARFIKSVSHAFQGIKDSFDGQSNIKIQVFIAIIVLIAAFQFNISRIEWILLLLTIGAVFTSEMLNSAIETTVNLHCSQENSSSQTRKRYCSRCCPDNRYHCCNYRFDCFYPLFIQLKSKLYYK